MSSNFSTLTNTGINHIKCEVALFSKKLYTFVSLHWLYTLDTCTDDFVHVLFECNILCLSRCQWEKMINFTNVSDSYIQNYFHCCEDLINHDEVTRMNAGWKCPVDLIKQTHQVVILKVWLTNIIIFYSNVSDESLTSIYHVSVILLALFLSPPSPDSDTGLLAHAVFCFLVINKSSLTFVCDKCEKKIWGL